MHANCNICSEIFLPNAKILATPCGHTFHEKCLLTWLERCCHILLLQNLIFGFMCRSETCPSCRNKTTTNSILRIFLNLLPSEGNTQDPEVLQYKVDSLEFQVKLKEKQIENKGKACTKYKEINKGLR